MKLVFLLFLLVPIIFSGCNFTDSTPEISPQIVGEWESEDFITSGVMGEIEGMTYLFVMTFPGPIPSKPVLHILDLTNPKAPVEVATLDAPLESFIPVGALKFSDNVIYIPVGGGPVKGTAEGGLWTVDVSDPKSPRQLGLLDIQYPSVDLILYDNIAYIAGFASHRFFLADIIDPAKPQQIGEYSLSREQSVHRHNQNLAISGSMLYVVDIDGLDIIDVSLPSSPQEVGFYANPLWTEEELQGGENLGGTVIKEKLEIDDIIPDGFNDIAVSGQYAYVTTGKSGLLVLDVSNPASPQEVVQLNIPEAAHHVIIYDNLLYLLGTELADNSILHTIHILDISEPEKPLILDSVEDIPGISPFQFLVTTEGYIYFVNSNTLMVISIFP